MSDPHDPRDARQVPTPDDDRTRDAAPAATLDARGLLCPLPVLRTRKRLQPLAPGDVLDVLTDDPAAIVDVPHFCAEQGHVLLHEAEAEGGARRWRIAKGRGRAAPR